MYNYKKNLYIIFSATVHYASGVWCLGHVEEIDHITATFIKRFLLLLKSTPGYAIRIETESAKIESAIATRALTYYKKILNINKSPYPKRIFKNLRKQESLLHNRAKLN